MKQNNRQTSPFGRSTKADNAGLSLLQLTSFSFQGQSIKYYNETSKNTSDFIARLTRKKFFFCQIKEIHRLGSGTERFVLILFSFWFGSIKSRIGGHYTDTRVRFISL